MSDNWFYRIGNMQTGPFSAARLAGMIRAGQLSPNVLVRQENQGDWQVAGRAAGLGLMGTASRGASARLTRRRRIGFRGRTAQAGALARRRPAPNSPVLLISLAAGAALLVLLFVVVAVAITAGRHTPIANAAVVDSKGERSAKTPSSTTPIIAVLPRAIADEGRRMPDLTWIERAAEQANRSVVRIETNEGFGTGFTIASRGSRHLLLTNRHVVSTGETRFRKARVGHDCTVVLHSGAKLRGTLAALAKDEVDLAMVLVQTTELEPLGTIASFESVRVGEDVVAVGNPLGLDFTITNGIVSGKRDLDNRGDYFLQTSAAINHGNSGGPLIDKEARIVGVNTLGGDSAKGVQGIGFAIRADLARRPGDWEFFDQSARELADGLAE